MIIALQEQLQTRANPKTKAWWEGYLKGVIPFRGVKMGDIRAALHDWLAQQDIPARLGPEEQKQLALELLRQIHCEDKLAGVLYLQEVLIPSGAVDWPQDLPRLAALFQDGYIGDWNTCDWFCVKALAALWQREGVECARAIANWRAADNLWQRRSAGVAFVNQASQGDVNFPGFTDMLLEVCSATAQWPDRFAQTGTGWVLRELSHAEPSAVERFVEQHVSYLSREGLSYAVEKLPTEMKVRLKALHKQAVRQGA